ncbi:MULTISPECIES: MerR family transcriptional regulator [unclassified Nesterenkonia]|uniref:MerR family transcriptional regulator n=1 Tax=unclassified Nesterenkonia TaxID=2629769 RepID=UPI001F4C8B33|nr:MULTISPECIES: MerR family transcriptional regulator [unclassified Nesterenkonia]MCH8560318.1 MerR family transcriptional regulator [Nesterenkonia sp. DZ6]MCH8572217.1 MerR family transcriptional regulator [Nesterenkonia sp. AY15]
MSENLTDTQMHIGELAERTGLSLRTIRHYGDIGLLPATSRTEGGFRVYTEADLARLQRINYLKPLGFSLEEISEVVGLLDLESLTPDQRDAAEAALHRVTEERRKLAAYLAQAEHIVEDLESKLTN